MSRTDMARVMDRLPPHALEWIKRQQANKVDLAFKNEPYFSRVRFPAAITAGPPVVYTFPKGQTVQAFTYGLGGAMANAGYATGIGFDLGTLADTNLITTTGKVTNNSDMVVIDGLSISPTPRTDPVLLQKVIAEISVQAGFGGNVNDYKLATPLHWTAAQGLFGSGYSQNIPADATSTFAPVSTLSNGLPGSADVRWFSDPIVWMPAPESDSVFAMQLQVQRDVVVPTVPRAAGAGAGGAGTSQVAQAPSSTVGDEGTFIDFTITLWGNQFGPRSRNR